METKEENEKKKKQAQSMRVGIGAFKMRLRKKEKAWLVRDKKLTDMMIEENVYNRNIHMAIEEIKKDANSVDLTTRVKEKGIQVLQEINCSVDSVGL